MQTEKDTNAKSKKKTKTKIFKLLLLLFIIAVLSVLIFVPVYISSEKGHRMLLAKINKAIGGKTDFADLSMSWWKGINITGVSFNDNADTTSVKIKRIITKPHYASILTGSLSFGQTIVDEPRIEINLKDSRPAPEPKTRTKLTTKKPSPVLPVSEINLVVNNGNLKVNTDDGRAVELSQLNSHLNLRSPGKETCFELYTTVIDKSEKSSVYAKGRIKPKRRQGWTLKAADGDMSLEVNDLNLDSLVPVFAIAGVDIQAEGKISTNIKTGIKDGKLETLIGTINAKDLNITGPALAGDSIKTASLDVDTKLQRQKDTLNIEVLKIKTDWADVNVKGLIPTTFASLSEVLEPESSYDLKGDAVLDLAAIFSQMPATLGIDKETKVTSGQLKANVRTFAAEGKRKITATAIVDNLAGTVEGKSITFAQPINAQAQITSGKAGIRYEKLNLSSAFAKIGCTGTSELLDYNAQIDLSALQQQLGQFIDLGPYQMSGQINSEGQFSSRKDKISATSLSVCRNLQFSSNGKTISEPQVRISLSGTFDTKKKTADFEHINTQASFGSVNMKDSRVQLDQKALKLMKLSASANVDLAALSSYASLFADLPETIQLAGKADTQITVHSEDGVYNVKTDETEIRDLKFILPDKPAFEQSRVSLIFDADVEPAAKNIEVNKFELTSPQIKLKGNFRRKTQGPTTELSGRADCQYDWQTISNLASAFLPENLNLKGKRTDSVAFRSIYPAGQTDKLLANLSSSGRLGFEQADFMGLTFGPTEVDIKIQNGLLQIKPFTTAVNSGQLSFAAKADFKQKPTLLKTPEPMKIAKDIQINDQTTRKLLMYVNPVFAGTVNVSGVANFDCEKLAIPLAEADKNDAEVIGTLSINNLRLQTSDLLGQILSAIGKSPAGKDITVHPTRFVLQEGFLRYENMQMDVGDNPVNFAGVIGLDKSLDMSVTLPYTLEGETVNVGQETDDERLAVPLTGTVDNPQLDLGRILQEQLKQRLKQELKKGLEDLFK